MLSENTRVRAKIQTAFEQLAMPHVAKVRCGYDIIKVAFKLLLISCMLFFYLLESGIHTFVINIIFKKTVRDLNCNDFG